MSTPVNSSASTTTTLAQKLTDLKNSTKTSIVSSLNSSGDNLTQTLLSAGSDQFSISAVSTSLSSISAAAKNNSVADAMKNVQLFAESLQNEGYDTISTLKYLSIVRNLAEDNPDKFSELFSGDTASGASSTISSLTA